MTPKLSHDLAALGQSPYWDGRSGLKRWNAFLDEVEQERYATYEDLPPRLKRMYDTAYRQLQTALSTQG